MSCVMDMDYWDEKDARCERDSMRYNLNTDPRNPDCDVDCAFDDCDNEED